ncbi:hypothetical protein FSARC_2977 [Fusarium sarcochroum]|uniref:Uncharacterized protein n=1 Tax=Fusarium sarcochroum TaxID=1208366 RepID=A0A8H4U5B5_9HYPO|nr:hypothetical protein FSARC_2977 [Fusarium sarcochroum]
MSSFFRRKQETRRNTDDDYNKMQYSTPRGNIPAKAVAKQVREAIVDTAVDDPRAYPHLYSNSEAGGRKNFELFEQRNRPDQTPLYEVPVNSRVDLNKNLAPMKKVLIQQKGVQPRDRARVVRNELNDPGPFRGIVAVDQATSRPCGVAGVIYHPEGNLKGFERAPMEPLDQGGRQYLRRFADDSADPHRVTTWPPRDENSGELSTYDVRATTEMEKRLRKQQEKERRKQRGR